MTFPACILFYYTILLSCYCLFLFLFRRFVPMPAAVAADDAISSRPVQIFAVSAVFTGVSAFLTAVLAFSVCKPLFCAVPAALSPADCSCLFPVFCDESALLFSAVLTVMIFYGLVTYFHTIVCVYNASIKILRCIDHNFIKL